MSTSNIFENKELPSNIKEILQEYLVDLNKTMMEINSKKDLLTKDLHQLNDILPEQEKIWSEHVDKYINELDEQLKAQDITLNDEEKNNLRNELLKNTTNKEQQAEQLEKSMIKIPKKASSFAVNACSAVMAALSRDLKEVNDSYTTVKKLPVISSEKSNAEEIIEGYKNQHKEITDHVKSVVSEIKDLGLQPKQLNLVEQAREEAAQFLKEQKIEEKEAETLAPETI